MKESPKDSEKILSPTRKKLKGGQVILEEIYKVFPFLVSRALYVWRTHSGEGTAQGLVKPAPESLSLCSTGVKGHPEAWVLRRYGNWLHMVFPDKIFLPFCLATSFLMILATQASWDWADHVCPIFPTLSSGEKARMESVTAKASETAWAATAGEDEDKASVNWLMTCYGPGILLSIVYVLAHLIFSTVLWGKIILVPFNGWGSQGTKVVLPRSRG